MLLNCQVLHLALSLKGTFPQFKQLFALFETHFRGGSRGRVQGVRTPTPPPPPPPRDDLRFSNTTGILQEKKTMWFIGVEVEQETSAPPPKKNPASAPAFIK